MNAARNTIAARNTNARVAFPAATVPTATWTRTRRLGDHAFGLTLATLLVASAALPFVLLDAVRASDTALATPNPVAVAAPAATVQAVAPMLEPVVITSSRARRHAEGRIPSTIGSDLVAPLARRS